MLIPKEPLVRSLNRTRMRHVLFQMPLSSDAVLAQKALEGTTVLAGLAGGAAHVAVVF